MARGQAKNGWNGVLGRRNSMITGPVVGGAGHIVSSEGRPGWPECVCSMGPLVPVCLPCWCLFRVTVCLFPSPAGFAPSFPATEAFSTFWSAITTQATTSISESGALTPRPSRCRVSAGSSSERGARRGTEERTCACLDGGAGRFLRAHSSASPCGPCEPSTHVSQFMHSQHEKQKEIKKKV